jgi:hypothetical protein
MGHKVIHKGAKAGGRRQKAEGRRREAKKQEFLFAHDFFDNFGITLFMRTL